MSESDDGRRRAEGLVRALGGRVPVLDPTAWVAQTASVTGSVVLGARVSVWYGVSVRGDLEQIQVGDDTNVQESSSLHADPGSPLTVGRSVTVGHGAVLHGCTIGDHVLIGMSSTVMNGAVIGSGSIVAAGALVPEGVQVPPGSLVVGSPGRVARPTTQAEGRAILANAEEYVRLAELHAAAES